MIKIHRTKARDQENHLGRISYSTNQMTGLLYLRSLMVCHGFLYLFSIRFQLRFYCCYRFISVIHFWIFFAVGSLSFNTNLNKRRKVSPQGRLTPGKYTLSHSVLTSHSTKQHSRFNVENVSPIDLDAVSFQGMCHPRYDFPLYITRVYNICSINFIIII